MEENHKILLKDFIVNKVGITNDDIHKVLDCFSIKKVRRGTLISKSGDVCRDFYIMTSGCIRTYYISNEGIEKTRLILFDRAPVVNLLSFMRQEPSVEYIEAIEDAVLFAITHTDFLRLKDEIPRWKDFYSTILERSFIFQNKKIEDLVVLSAKERYLKILKDTPYYFQRVSNKVLASYLDISPETLSRLKSQ